MSFEIPEFTNVEYREFTPLKSSAELDKGEIIDALNRDPIKAVELATKYWFRYDFEKNRKNIKTHAQIISHRLTPIVIGAIAECHYNIINDRAFLLNVPSTPQSSHDFQKEESLVQ